MYIFGMLKLELKSEFVDDEEQAPYSQGEAPTTYVEPLLPDMHLDTPFVQGARQYVADLTFNIGQKFKRTLRTPEMVHKLHIPVAPSVYRTSDRPIVVDVPYTDVEYAAVHAKNLVGSTITSLPKMSVLLFLGTMTTTCFNPNAELAYDKVVYATPVTIMAYPNGAALAESGDDAGTCVTMCYETPVFKADFVTPQCDVQYVKRVE